MELRDFDFQLPPELIAQRPLAQRDHSRLLVVDRASATYREAAFADIAGCLRPGDLLVVNDTRVIPARLLGRKGTGGRVEVFLHRRLPGVAELWDCLVRSSKPLHADTLIHFDEGVVAQLDGERQQQSFTLRFTGTSDFAAWLERRGSVPLPPYIRRPADDEDRHRYQTVFAQEPGAVAAPTAGLHFTQDVLATLARQGVRIATLTLHVGLGTFMPIRDNDLSRHQMHRERYFIPPATAAAIAETKRCGGRVVAVGTTTTRALEHAAASDGSLTTGAGEADIFITPGYRFRVIDALLTNFHLPGSTLLLLVAAFAGRELMLASYNEAIARRFRFYSYGDAMFIV